MGLSPLSQLISHHLTLITYVFLILFRVFEDEYLMHKNGISITLIVIHFQRSFSFSSKCECDAYRRTIVLAFSHYK